MRVQYAPLTATDWHKYYVGQAGGLLVGFKGDRYQRGAGLGNILKGLFRMIVPLAKSAGKAVAKQALTTGKDVARDLLEGENLGESIEKHGKLAAGNLIHRGADRLVRKIQTGEGLGSRMKTRKSINRIGKRKIAIKKRSRSDFLGRI